MSLKKSIIKNGIAALIQKGIKIAEQLLLIPFFIQYWGAAYYGEWLTLTIIPATLALADIGFGSAAANTFLLKYAAGDKQGAANTAKTGIRVVSLLIIGAIILSAIVVLVLQYLHVFDKSIIPANEAIGAVLILLTARILSFYQVIFEAFFRAARRASISINFQTFIALSNVVAGLIVILSGGKAIDYAIGVLLVIVVLNPIYIFLATRVLGLSKTHKAIVNQKEILPLLKTGFGYFLSPIWQAVYYQGMTFVVRITLGPVAVTIFNTLRTLVRSSSQAFAMAITAVYPDFQFELGAGNKVRAKKIFIGVLILNLIMAFVFIICLGLFGSSLYNWWTNNQLVVPQTLWIFFIVGIFFYAIWFTCSFIFEASNRPYINTVSSLVCSILAIIMSWFLASWIGLIGVAISAFLFDFIMSIYLYNKGKVIIEYSFKQLLDYFLSFIMKIFKRTNKHVKQWGT